MSGSQKRWRDAIDGDAVFLRQVTQALQLVHGGVETPIANLWISTDVADAIPRQVPEVRFIRGCALASEFHQGASARGRGGGPVATPQDDRDRARRGDEFSPIHGPPF